MERIDFNKLRTVVRDRTSATRNVKASNQCYPEYTSLISNYMVKHNSFKEKESALHIMSMQNWIEKKDQHSATAPNYGEIWLADLGSNYKPECSYVHPTVVIENIGNMVCIVPSTTSPQLLADAYHPVDNPEGNEFYRKVGRADGFASDCVLLLSNIRAISRTRLLDRKGTMPGVSPLNKASVFWEIKENCFRLSFPKKNIELFNANKKISELEEAQKKLVEQIEELKAKITQKES